MHIRIVTGDITRLNVDAIVNAANSSLLGGGGVDGAIHRAAGPRLLEATRRLRATSLPHGLPPGKAVATPGFDLPARWVIHTVGPNRRAGQNDPKTLRACFTSSLEAAEDVGAHSVAFSAIGAGVYGWSAREVAQAARLGILGSLSPDDTGFSSTGPADACEAPAFGEYTWPGIDLIEFVAFTPAVLRAFEGAFADRL